MSEEETNTFNITVPELEAIGEGGPETIETLGPEDLDSIQEEVTGSSVDPNKVLELGDRILIIQDGDKTIVGTVYYRTGTLLKLRTDGDNTTLINFDRDYNDEPGKEEDKFADDANVKVSYILDKHISNKFREQQGFQADMILQGWKDGKQEAQYRITKIYEDRDAIEIENVQSEEKEDLDFDYCGIPLNKPFDILNISDIAPEEPVEETKEEEVEETNEEEDEDEDEDEVLGRSDIGRSRYIFVRATEEVEQVAAAKERITEDVQKNSALSDFINMLPPKDQKDPLILRDYRLLVEVINQMRKDITNYAADDTVVGIIDPSVSTFADLIQKVQVPNGRPVFKMNKRLYVHPREWKEEEFKKEAEEKGLFYKADDIANMDSYNALANVKAPARTVVKGEQKTSIRFYETQKEVNTIYERPWNAIKDTTDPIPIVLTDDVQGFRNIVPDNEHTIKGYIPVKEPMTQKERDMVLIFKNPPMYPLLSNLLLGTEQVLSPTYRKGEKGGKVTLLPSEANTQLVSYLIFPLKVSSVVGSKRSGLLAVDMTRSLEDKIYIEEVFEEVGIPESDMMSPATIFAMNVEGGVLPNYEIGPYLKDINMKGLNIPDFMTVLDDLGISQFDYSKDVLKVLIEKITGTQAQLKLALQKQREQIQKVQAPTPNPILQIDKEALIGGEPFLTEALKSFDRQNEILKDSDVAFFTYMLLRYNDFFQAQLGGQTTIIIKERLNVVKARELEQREINKMLRIAELNEANVPMPNRCKHVAELKGIRREEDEHQFYKKLSLFLTKYQGNHTDDWTSCIVCDQHLLCAHERLMIKAFLYPREKEAIQKDLHLHFSGGLEQGHYLCRICGQPMDDLEYENTLQFDDEGRPMNGHAVIIDEEELDIGALEMLLNLPLNNEATNKKTEEQTIYYNILNELARNAGLNFKPETYTQLIQHLKTAATIYITSKENVTLTTATPTYDTYKYRYLVSFAANLILIEAQTAPIEYIPYKTVLGSTNPGFGGYPLDEDLTNREGLKYMATNIYSFMKHKKESEPWKHLRYALQKGKTTDDDVIDAITNWITKSVMAIIDKNQILQQLLTKKRLALKENREIGGQFRDGLPLTFLPNNRQYKDLTVEKAVAESSSDPRLRTLYWLKAGDTLAATHKINLLDPLAVNILCCRSPVNQPYTFWTEQQESLIKLGGNRMLVPRLAAKSLQPHFVPRPMEAIISEVPKEKLYALFLKVCYRGDHIGKSHEPDINHTCIWCGFNFGKPYSLMDTDEAIKAISTNKITTNEEEFQTLLDIVHVNHNVKMPPLMTGNAPTVLPNALNEFKMMTPPPILTNWSELYENLYNGLQELSTRVQTSSLDLAGIVNPFLTEIQPMKELVLSNYRSDTKEHEKIREGLSTILKLNWYNFNQVLLTYFLKPCQNILFNYNIKIPLAYLSDRDVTKKLARDHIAEIKKFIENDRNVNAEFSVLAKNNVENKIVHANLKYFIDQLSIITSFKNRINPAYIQQGAAMFQVLKQVILFGTLATLYDPERNDDGTPGISKLAVSQTLPAMIGKTIQNFMEQQLTYDDERVKLIIADSAEKEKQAMLTGFKKLSEEERRVEQINKSLKLGRFALGANYEKYSKYSAELFDTRTAEIKNMAEITGLGGRSSGDSTGYHSGINNHAEDN